MAKINFGDLTGDGKKNGISIGLNRAKDTLSNVLSLAESGNAWPQTKINQPHSNTSGFLPPVMISPNLSLLTTPTGDNDAVSVKKKIGNYEYEDWMGQKITPNGLIPLDTKDRFSEGLTIPKTKTELDEIPYSLRDHYLIFGDTSTDYFKHGLQIIDGLNPIENPNGDSDLRLSQFKATPFENNDPVMFGFELIIDDLSSPLLNGSVDDFLANYSSIKEIESRVKVYEDFKNQFIKFFKTRSTKAHNSIDPGETSISNTTSQNATINKDRGIYKGSNFAYMSYYIQKISGLEKLIESNKPGVFKYLADYRKDWITLNFLEDVSLSIGTLSHLYKLLYWSKPNGKTMVPENLLRFNCKIIVSETRNFNRVKKAMNDGNLEIIKDNVSRYIYSLRECQLFFDKPSHGQEIDMGSIKIHDTTQVMFDYKYSTVKFERFIPTTNGFGEYVGYDNGSIWKIGNPGVRNGTQSTNEDISVPRFYTKGKNSLRQNGVESEFIFKSIGDKSEKGDDSIEVPSQGDVNDPNSYVNAPEGTEGIKKTSKLKALAIGLAKKTAASVIKEVNNVINVRAQLLARTINKALINFQGGTISPPRNIYTQSGEDGSLARAGSNIKDRFFYDLRGDLVGFLGGAVGNVLPGSGFSKR